ncbi:MAG: hypothetical protein MK211_05855 [Flavobacteriales bacterium]|jgi:hypothetical protein|uniref:hypothetical protein n=1 Tax=Candidatus Ulvibacter alkanivorans TaxID=2267620 RepID=UPI000DF137B2|nr:hypothetical protein [Candidatus Ulvibacter alkanivorans]MCH2489658.1 hypothetical protein [Flavobacteriales bacterium]
MEKLSKQQEQHFRAMMREAGGELPSSALKANVMNAIGASSKTIAYKPLIGKKGWSLLTIIACLVILLVVLLPFEGFGFLSQIEWKNPMLFDYTLPNLTVPKTFLYAIAFTALFLLQVPFLKRIHGAK